MKNLPTKLLGIACAALLLQACDQGPSASKVEADIAKAQAEGQKLVADAQADLEKANAQNNKDIVDAQSDRKTDAAAVNSAPVTPGVPPPGAAGNDVANAQSDAKARLADAQYALDKATADADHLLAVARCESQSGDALASCNDATNTKHDADLAAAKAKRDSAKRSAASS